MGTLQLPLSQRGRAPNFRPISIVAKWLHGSTCHLVWRWASAQATFVGWGPRSPSAKRRRCPQIFDPCSLWPNGWMDQDATWHGGRPQPRRLCVRWGASSLPKKGAGPSSQIFGPFLLWPNGWKHQDATLYIGSPQPTGLC